MLEDVFLELCKRRIEYCEHNDIWELRRQWGILKYNLLSQLNDGSYMFSPLQRFEFPDEIISCWSSTDMLALKVITKALYQFMKGHLSPACVHVKGHGGLKKAVQQTHAALPDYTCFFRSDITQYYESIDFENLMAVIDRYVKHPVLTQLIVKALKRTETFGGNFYHYDQKGIPKRSPLSPLLSAIALLPLDQAMENINGIFYIRFADDWIVLTKSKTMLRKVIKKTHTILNTLKLQMHPTKTYMGRIDKGFNFLGYFYQPCTLLPSKETIRRFYERSSARYAYPSTQRRRPPPDRDVSEYQANESAPTDGDVVHVLCALNWQSQRHPDMVTALQRYVQQWGNWVKAGLQSHEHFITSVQTHLPSLAFLWSQHDLGTTIPVSVS